jgi:hypothetical protein
MAQAEPATREETNAATESQRKTSREGNPEIRATITYRQYVNWVPSFRAQDRPRCEIFPTALWSLISDLFDIKNMTTAGSFDAPIEVISGLVTDLCRPPIFRTESRPIARTSFSAPAESRRAPPCKLSSDRSPELLKKLAKRQTRHCASTRTRKPLPAHWRTVLCFGASRVTRPWLAQGPAREPSPGKTDTHPRAQASKLSTTRPHTQRFLLTQRPISYIMLTTKWVAIPRL